MNRATSRGFVGSVNLAIRIIHPGGCRSVHGLAPCRSGRLGLRFKLASVPHLSLEGPIVPPGTNSAGVSVWRRSLRPRLTFPAQWTIRRTTGFTALPTVVNTAGMFSVTWPLHLNDPGFP
jgi:hypothetical protein